MYKNILPLLLAILYVSGCTVQQKYWGDTAPIFMNETARPLISSTRVLVGLDHDTKMGPPIIANGNSGQQFGLIGALVESAIVHGENNSLQARQRQLTLINKATLDFNIASHFREAVEKSIKPLGWLNVSYVVKKHDVKIPEVEQTVDSLDEDALLLIDNKFLMAEDFSKLQVFSYVAIYANEQNLVKIAKDARPSENPPTIYKNMFRYEHGFEGTYTTPDRAIKGWSDNDGEMLKRALALSIDNLVNQIVTDFSYTTVSFNSR